MGYKFLKASRISAGLKYLVYNDPGITTGYDGEDYQGQIVPSQEGIVSFDQLNTIPKMPAVKPMGYEITEMLWIPDFEQWIAFHRCDHRKSSIHGYEHQYLGPYLISGEPPPTEDEGIKSKSHWNKDDFIKRLRIFYRE